MQRFQDGERNTKFFHAYVRGRRNKLQIQKTGNNQGVLLENQQDIREEAFRVFQNNFTGNYSMLYIIPTLISDEEAEHMTKEPKLEEFKDDVF